VVVAALSVAAAGCGVSAGTGTSDAISAGMGLVPSAAQVEQAAERTAELTTFRLLTEVDATESGLDIGVRSEGAFDLEAGRSQVTTEATAGSMFGDLASSEVVVDGDVAYLKAGFLDLLGIDAPWVRIDLDQLAELGELDADEAFDLGSVDSATSLLDLLASVGEVEELGAEAVRGVPTRHLGVDIEIGKALDEAAEERAASVRSQLEELGVDVDELSTVPAEVWVDDDGFVRRFTLTLDLATLATEVGEDELASEAGAVTLTLEMYDLDQPVDISVPPADQVSELDPEQLFGD
jgi:hypothetical protein